jgi:hypothetical protein
MDYQLVNFAVFFAGKFFRFKSNKNKKQLIFFILNSPPCPSQIVAKLAFLPPTPTYKLITSNEQSNNSGGNNQPHTPLNGENTTAQPASHNRTDDHSSSTNVMHTLFNSSRRLCSSFVCSQQSQQRDQQPNYQTLFTNAKLVMMEKGI